MLTTIGDGVIIVLSNEISTRVANRRDKSNLKFEDLNVMWVRLPSSAFR